MDLNLLRVFVAVYETRSLTEAASRLFITQPAVSQALGRLRRSLDDPLFERTGRGVAATPLAHSIYPDLHGSLLGIDRTLDAVHGFDPESSTHRFRIAMSELGEVGYFPALFSAIRESARCVTVEVVPIDVCALPAWLTRGTIDLAISPILPNDDYDPRLLKTESYVALMNRDNELASGEITTAQLLGAERVTIAGDSSVVSLEHTLNRVGNFRQDAVTVHRYSSIPPLLSECPNLWAIVPESIADGWASAWPLSRRSLPFELPPVEISLLRRKTVHNTSALEWLHRTVLRALSGQPGDFSSIGVASQRDA